MGEPDSELTPEERLRIVEENNKALKRLLAEREAALIREREEKEKLRKQVEEQSKVIEDRDHEIYVLANFYESLDEKLKNEPHVVKRTRADELLLIKPFVRLRTALSDYQDGIAIIQRLAENEREHDWIRHYFFEPLNKLNEFRAKQQTGYLLYKKIANEFSATPPRFSVAQIEALLYRMMRAPQYYGKAFHLLQSKQLALSQIGPELQADAAYSAYQDELMRRLRQFNDLSDEELHVLDLRARYALDNRAQFERLLAAKEFPNSESLSKAYERIKELEQSDRQDFYPVNLRWFRKLPKDIGDFLRAQRPKGR